MHTGGALDFTQLVRSITGFHNLLGWSTDLDFAELSGPQFGPAPATCEEVIQNLSLIRPQHFWNGKGRCTRCGLKISKHWPKLEVLDLVVEGCFVGQVLANFMLWSISLMTQFRDPLGFRAELARSKDQPKQNRLAPTLLAVLGSKKQCVSRMLPRS